MKDVDGMVRRLGKFTEDLDFAPGVDSRKKKDFLEIYSIDVIGTGTAQQIPSGIDAFDGVEVDVFITPERRGEGRFLFGKSRRIKDNDVKFLPALAKILEHVLSDEFMFVQIDPIQAKIFPGHFQRRFRRLHCDGSGGG